MQALELSVKRMICLTIQRRWSDAPPAICWKLREVDSAFEEASVTAWC